jgi:hypothetical protein
MVNAGLSLPDCLRCQVSVVWSGRGRVTYFAAHFSKIQRISIWLSPGFHLQRTCGLAGGVTAGKNFPGSMQLHVLSGTAKYSKL